MTGVLNAGGPPPAPNPQPDAPSPSMGLMSAPQPQLGGALQAPQRPAQMPAPTHGQTVAALRHVDAVKAQLAKALKDPAVGKSSIKKKIVDGMAELVADRILTPAIAVQQLADVPDEPFQQKKWLINHYRMALVDEHMVLAQHTATHAGIPHDMMDRTADPDNHLEDVEAVRKMFGARGG